MAEIDDRELVPIRDGLLIGDLADLATVSLAGSTCEACAETVMGVRDLCPNCGSQELATVSLSPTGQLWTFTVARHRPPGNYRGPEPFEPYGVGLVELPEGVRIMAPLDADIDRLEIGQEMTFAPYVRHDESKDVVAFCYAAVRVSRNA